MHQPSPSVRPCRPNRRPNRRAAAAGRAACFRRVVAGDVSRWRIAGLRGPLTAGLAVLLGLAASSGCLRQPAREVVVYAALDREFSEPILQQFTAETGITVRAVYDQESTKTVGLFTRLVNERAHPQCDVFWNNEILHTLRLQQQNLLATYAPPVRDSFPQAYRDRAGQWHGLAARARVLIVNRQLVPKEQWPRSIEDLIDPRWKGKVGIAKPLFGTTATHAAVLFDRWGAERAEAFFEQLKANARVLSGNKQVAVEVAQGNLLWGLTDTDDAIIERDQGFPVELIYPDQEPEQAGTLFIPNTLAILRDSPNPDHARVLIDFLLSGEVEDQLAQGSSAQFPVGDLATARSRAAPQQPVRWMEVDFSRAAAAWDLAAKRLRERFATSGP